MSKIIVVIDDDRTIQATLSAVLTRHGYAVRVGQNAAQGRKRVAEAKPDLLLLDLGLPDADGLDVLRELKAAYPELPVIVLSAHDSLANAIESIKLGAFHFLSKPYVVEELVSLCTRALDHQTLARETAKLRGEKEALQKQLREAEAQLGPVAISRMSTSATRSNHSEALRRSWCTTTISLPAARRAESTAKICSWERASTPAIGSSRK